MGTSDDRNSGRGWSMVFDDRTEGVGDRDTDEHQKGDFDPKGDVDPQTIIDGDMSEELKAALATRAAETGKNAEGLLANVTLAEDPDPDGNFSSAVEKTVRAPAPIFELSQTPISGLVDELPPLQFEGDANATAHDHPTFRPDEGELSPPEHTREAPIPYDLFHEGSLPDAVKAKPVITRRKISKVEAAEPPPAPIPNGEETLLDLAAQLGMAPEPKVVRDDDEPTDDGKRPAQTTMELPGAPNDEIDLLPFLDKDAPEDAKKKGPKKVPIIQQRSRPAEGPDAADIQRWAGNADAAARTIPLVVGIFVAVGTIVAMVMLFTTGERRQEHIEMRFLSLTQPGRSAARDSDVPSRIAIDTIPEGVFVLYGRELLGKTPLLVDLQIELDEKIAVELSGPYFERWVGEVARDPTGEYRVSVELVKSK